MQVLVTSPIPSHPQNHGNRARVYSLCRTLQKRGYKIHFVYGGFEGLTAEQEHAMRSTWDHVYVIPHDLSTRRRKSHRNHHMIDDWYVPQVTEITERILRIWKIDFCLANYVWFSKWLDSVPAGIPKYLDTHDMFANRDKALKKDGIDGNWYSTTPAEEAKAFNRADRVLAIQESEAESFRKATDQTVTTLGHYLPAQFLKPTQTPKGRKLKVGYLASNNPINQHSLHYFGKILTDRSNMLEAMSFHLAGAICSSDTAQNIPFEKLGFVDTVASFYEDMDIILNPNLGGTGLKIKSVEALSYGKPLVATRDAMVGIETTEPFHQCENIETLADALAHLANTPEDITLLERSGRKAYASYSEAQLEALDLLFPASQSSLSGDATEAHAAAAAPR